MIRALVLVIVALALGACRPGESPFEPKKTPKTAFVAASVAAVTPTPDAHEAGRRIYNFRCYYCHGYSGDAKTLAASFMQPPPRDFQAATPQSLPRDALLRAVTDGVPGSAMAGFAATLSPREIELVVGFVQEEFLRRKARNTAYHTPENGWPDHRRYRVAYPFATGEIPLDRPADALTSEQVRGKRLYLSACVSCHDRGRVEAEGAPWQLRAMSYPPGNYTEYVDEDAQAHLPAPSPAAGAPAVTYPYELHDTPPKLAAASPLVRRGEPIFQQNCAFCHAADGSGRNWIGSFMEPPPPDFTARDAAARLTRERVAQITREGLPQTSMPAWKQVLPTADLDAVVAYVVDVFGTGAARAVATPAVRAAGAR